MPTAGSHQNHPMLAASHIRPVKPSKNPRVFTFREQPGEDARRTLKRLAFRWLPDKQYIRPLLEGQVKIEPAEDGWMLAKVVR